MKASKANKQQRHLTFIVLFAITLLFAGCVTTGQVFQAYPGPPAEQSEVALLSIMRQFLGGQAIVRTIDGMPLGRFKYNNTQVAELLPGKHTVSVDFVSGNVHSVEPMYLVFTVQAGGSYVLRAATLTQSFGDALSLGLGGGGQWTAWISDVKSHRVIAGVAREEPTHWYEK